MVLTQLLQIADVLLLGSMTAAAAEIAPLSPVHGMVDHDGLLLNA